MRQRHALTSFFAAAALGAMLSSMPALAQRVADTSDSVTVNTSRSVHQITGWQNDLVSRTPNLGNYYWTPVSQVDQVNTTQRTGKGAMHAPTVIDSVSHYVKPIKAALPECSHNAMPMRASTQAHALLSVRKETTEPSYQTSTSAHAAVLTYGSSQECTFARLAGTDTRSRNLSVNGRLFGAARQ